MNPKLGRLQEETGLALQEALKEPHPIVGYQDCIKIVNAAVGQLKEIVISEAFVTNEEEIQFFKHVAPEIYSLLFYYQEIKELESDRAYKEHKAFAEMLLRKKKAIDDYFRRHDTIRHYLNQGSTYLDLHLFTRRSEGQWSEDENGVYIPPDLTIGAYWVSRIKANALVRDWIDAELARGDPRLQSLEVVSGQKLRWTGSRADLILLLCGLFLARCFNDGLVTLKEVMEWGEQVMGIKLGQFHVALNEMSIRKDPVKFFKVLIDLMTRKFDSMTD